MRTDTSLDLLSHFSEASYDEWKEAAEKLLKGAPFEKKMLTKTPEGIVLRPIYNKSDLDALGGQEGMPGADGFLRGASASGYLSRPWDIAQEQPYGDPTIYNAALLKDLNAGQNSVNLLLDAASQLGIDPDNATDLQIGECGVSISSVDDLRQAFEGLEAKYLPIHFQSGCSGAAIESIFFAWLESQGVGQSEVEGSLNMDPLGVLAARGILPADLQALFDELALLVKHNAEHAPSFAAAGISTLAYHNAGASATEELASALASGVAYLKAMQERGISIDTAVKQVRFTFAVGGNFFMEIAKFRAARSLWAKVVAALGGNAEEAKLDLHARTGLTNKTRLDPYVNILRATTEAFSAVVGGAQSICVGCYDEAVRLPDDFSRRVSRNLQIILQEECELTAVVDPAGGSWYLESLTDELARKSWEAFQEIEKEGGIVAALKKGSWQKRLAQTRTGKETSLGQRRSSLIGTNQYPNLEEKPLAAGVSTSSEFKAAAREVSRERRQKTDTSALKRALEAASEPDALPLLVSAAKRGVSLETICDALRRSSKSEVIDVGLPGWRLAGKYEAMRDAAGAYERKNGEAPKIYLVNLGPLKKHKIRADFTRAFFAAGGFSCQYSDGVESVDTAVKGYRESGARMAVICGTDPDYLEWVPKISQALKQADPEMKLLLAGFPGDQESGYKKAGLDDYIFVKSNNYEVNAAYLKWMGVL